ncbi:methyltransferase [archaeon]|nr:methyltransferase [archaeon]
MPLIYEPAEDSELILEVLKERIKNKSFEIFEVGVGSGYVLEGLRKYGFTNLSGCDKNPEAVNICKSKNLNVFFSNLFSKVENKFDVIFFNPPYLPENDLEDSESKISTTGGKKGSEILNKFLKEVENYLTPNGRVFVLTSSLTKGIKWPESRKTIVGRKKLFFEELFVWELAI